jgi:hypoxanthine phosphoribosyltransferase
MPVFASVAIIIFVYSYVNMSMTIGLSPVVGVPLPFVSSNLEKHREILIVDDISDSGETFLEVIKKLKDKYPDKNFKSLAIFYKPSSKFKPDFYFHKTDEWIEFFWEKY